MLLAVSLCSSAVWLVSCFVSYLFRYLAISVVSCLALLRTVIVCSFSTRAMIINERGVVLIKGVAAARPIRGRDLIPLRHRFTKRPIRGREVIEEIR